MRPRLLERMRRAADSRLTLLSAPAGAGKTVLASSWAAEVAGGGELTLAWLTLDDGDERPGVFWAYVIESLAGAGVDVAGVGVPGRADSLDRTLLNRLAQSLALHRQPVVLVVDSADLPGDPLPGADIDYLVRSAGGNLRLVLLVRSDPMLSLHRYRLAGTMTELRLDDLRFDVAEAHLLMEVSGLDLPEQQVAALVARTGGWAAGLKFAAIAAAGQDHPEQALADFTGNNASVSDYLAREVLDTQPPDLREVLLRTSIVDELRPGLCNRLTGRRDGGRALELLAHGNSFVQRLSGVYRYQSLFRDFLRAQLAYEQPELVPDLQLGAAEWYAQHGCLARAVRHAAASGDWERAAGYVVDDLSIAALVVEVEDAGLAEAFADLPREVDGVAISLVRAALAASREDAAGCSHALRAARLRLADLTSASVPQRFSLELLDLVGSALGCDGAAEPDVDTGLALARTVEERLFTELLVPAAERPEIGALVHLCAGRLHLWAGDLDRAETVLASAAESAQGPRCRVIRLQCLDLAALVAAVSGRLSRSTASLAIADVEARHGGIDLDHRSAAAAVARAWVAGDQPPAARGRRLRAGGGGRLDRSQPADRHPARAGAHPAAARTWRRGRRALPAGSHPGGGPTRTGGRRPARLARGHAGRHGGRPRGRRRPPRRGRGPDPGRRAGEPRDRPRARPGAAGPRRGGGTRQRPGPRGHPGATGLVAEPARRGRAPRRGPEHPHRRPAHGPLGPGGDPPAGRTRAAAPSVRRDAPPVVQRQLRAGRLPDRHGGSSTRATVPRQHERPGPDPAVPAHVRTVSGDVIVEPLTAKELEVLAHLAGCCPRTRSRRRCSSPSTRSAPTSATSCASSAPAVATRPSGWPGSSTCSLPPPPSYRRWRACDGPALSEGDRGMTRGPLPRPTAWRAVLRCLVVSTGMLVRGEVRLPRGSIGRRIRFADGTIAPVYRETAVARAAAEPCVLVVSFRLRVVRGRGHRLFRWESLANTPLFVGFPGFVSKLWLAHDARKTYRGLYEWDGAAPAEAYARSLWRVLEPVSEDGRSTPGAAGLRRDALLVTWTCWPGGYRTSRTPGGGWSRAGDCRSGRPAGVHDAGTDVGRGQSNGMFSNGEEYAGSALSTCLGIGHRHPAPAPLPPRAAAAGRRLGWRGP